MGADPYTGQDFTHRREWLYELHEFLASVFAIDIGSMHLLANHFHHHLRSRPDLVDKMSDEDVVWRYRRAWPSYDPISKWQCEPTDAELRRMLLRAKQEDGYMERLRRSLSDISCFSARLKEPIWKMAN
jgi:hypothetical protein